MMHRLSLRDSRARWAQWVAAGALIVGVGGFAGRASAAVLSAINVSMANFSVTTSNTDASTFGTNNHGITPITYTVPQVNIPLIGTNTFDAADKNDAGTMWNSLQAVSTNLATATTATTYILYEQNLSLADSFGRPSGVTLNVYNRLPSSKLDGFHLGSNTAAGTDGLNPSPLNNAATPASANDGYATGTTHNELMGTNWIANGTSEGFAFTVSGLLPNTNYSVYLYGAGSTNGQGGRFEGASTILTDANGNTTGGTLNATNVSTNNDAANSYRSVFDATNSPDSELGKSWNVLSLTSDANGQLSFAEDGKSPTGGIKPALNGFQIDATPAPEPGMISLAALGALAMLRRRRA
jgi:MYXO-CTERM domain-containing protein